MDGNKNLTVKERHRENFAYRLELLMGRHRETPEKLMFNPCIFRLWRTRRRRVIQGSPELVCGAWIHGLTKLSEPAKQTPIMIVIIKTLCSGSSTVRLSLIHGSIPGTKPVRWIWKPVRRIWKPVGRIWDPWS